MSQRASFRADEYSFTLPLDLPLRLQARLIQALSALKKAMGRSMERADIEKLGAAEDELWAAAEELMSLAEPPPTGPLRTSMSLPGLLALLTSLMEKIQGQYPRQPGWVHRGRR